ncbi:MAG: Gfo/Idh/MocA family oxidoreductase [Clostridia bacterium]|nr:Gfo/Idh/MocA family oxidoreductase [Clostridia bacterium]MBR5772600.1 Gfo/Idh/MocA family oxidoreductase [Clostridia bacterium]
MIKTAVVGCGNVSKNHFHALGLIDYIEITAVADIKPERADEKARETGAKAYCDFDELLEKEELDCIHIVTPHYLHTSMAVKALMKGINVFLEKPCSVTAEEADALIKAEKRYGRQVGICFQNRYNESSITAKEIIDSGRYGAVKGARAFVTWNRGADYYSDDWHGTADKECGGVFINQAIHTLDLLQWFCGGCENITAHTFNDHLKGVIEVEDTVSALMDMKCGAKAVFYATTASAVNSDVFIEIVMEKVTLRIEGEKLIKFENDTAEILCDKSPEEFTGRSYWGHGHQAIIRDFYDCLKTGRQFSINAEEGAKAAKIVAAGYKSSKENITVEVK